MNELKTTVNSTVLFFLGRAMDAGYRLDKDIRKELDAFPDGHVIKFTTAGDNAALAFWKENGEIKRLNGKKAVEKEADLWFEFKNTAAAFLTLTGQIGIAEAYCQHRMLVYGDIYAAMGVVRIMDSVENYLFPQFMSKKILKRPPEKHVSSLRMYMGVIFGA